MNDKEKIQSAHAGLQAMLPRLAQLAGDWRPIYKTQEEAERYIQMMTKRDVGPKLTINPVWKIDHADLSESRIVAWSVIDFIS